MRALVEGEIGAWPVATLGLRYRRYRLADEAGCQFSFPAEPFFRPGEPMGKEAGFHQVASPTREEKLRQCV